MPDLTEAILSNLKALIDEYAATLAYILPRSLAMTLTLVIGWLLGRLLGKIVAAIVKFSKADDALRGTPLGVYLSKAGYTLSSLTDLATRVTVYIFSVALSIKVLRVPEAEAVAQSVFGVVGRIAVGILVLIIGMLIVEKIFDFVDKILVSERPVARVAANAAHAFSALLAVLAAFSAAGVDMSPLAGIAAALAQGVGVGVGAALVILVVALYWEELSQLVGSLRSRTITAEG